MFTLLLEKSHINFTIFKGKKGKTKLYSLILKYLKENKNGMKFLIYLSLLN